MNLQDMIWVAIDVSNAKDGCALVQLCEDYGIRQVKFGLELLSTPDRELVLDCALAKKFRVFWDGKFYDIPNTVGKASKAIANRGVAMFNVHASAGRKAVEAAVANKGNSKVAAVTLLTSMGLEDLRDLAYPEGTSKDDVVRAWALLAAQCKVDAIIGSAQEAPIIRSVFPEGRIVTPAIRPLWAAVGDQKRPTTPTEAIKAGATDLVIGRPITDPPKEIGSPGAALTRIIDEMAAAMG